MLPALIIFEQDGTLAETKQAVSEHTALLLAELQKLTKIALMSGESIRMLEDCVVGYLPSEALTERLYLLPTNGAELYTFKDGERITLYAHPFSKTEAERIITAICDGAEATRLVVFSQPSDGERIENRGSQITMSALGQHAPNAVKRAWDPDYSKRQTLTATISKLLPDYAVRWGGTTSIDVTRKDGTKAHGIVRLSEHLHVPVHEMVYVGNNVLPGGHNYIVKESGIRTIEIETPHDADRFIEMLLRQHGGA